MYDARGWGQLAHYVVDTSDAADLAWAPDGGALALWDSCLTYKVGCQGARPGHAVRSRRPSSKK